MEVCNGPARPRGQRGVTLIELLIVVTIIGILGAIAMSSYRAYTIRAQRTDATAALLKVAANQEKWYLGNNTYADTATFTALGILNTERGYYTIAIAAPAGGNLTTGFVATATPVAGGQTDDAKCTTLTLDNTGQKGFTGTGSVLECWK